MPQETVTLEGHIIDSLVLSKVLDLIIAHEGHYEIEEMRMGRTVADVSHARIRVSAPSRAKLEVILGEIKKHGAVVEGEDAALAPARKDGVFPEDFYSTTNLPTFIRLDGRWVAVQSIEMDCGIVVEKTKRTARAHCLPLHRIRRGDLLVVGHEGVKVTPRERKPPGEIFSFMGAGTSGERPKAFIIQALARDIREVKAKGKKVLFVGGPAIVHTGAVRHLEEIIRGGWIDILFAGNALATHDIEFALYGTSLGVYVEKGIPAREGHRNHLRAINTIRRLGSIRQAVRAGVLKSGVMHACVQNRVDFVLAGSIRDDGPLPEVITDVTVAQDEMRERIPQVELAIMVATTLHSVATGNLLPAAVRTVCVDSDPDTVTKLVDRGSHQTYGLVTDCEFFLKTLAEALR